MNKKTKSKVSLLFETKDSKKRLELLASLTEEEKQELNMELDKRLTKKD